MKTYCNRGLFGSSICSQTFTIHHSFHNSAGDGSIAINSCIHHNRLSCCSLSVDKRQTGANGKRAHIIKIYLFEPFFLFVVPNYTCWLGVLTTWLLFAGVWPYIFIVAVRLRVGRCGWSMVSWWGSGRWEDARMRKGCTGRPKIVYVGCRYVCVIGFLCCGYLLVDATTVRRVVIEVCSIVGRVHGGRTIKLVKDSVFAMNMRFSIIIITVSFAPFFSAQTSSLKGCAGTVEAVEKRPARFRVNYHANSTVYIGLDRSISVT